MAINFPAGDPLNSPFNAPNGVTYIWNTDGYWEAQTDSSGGGGGTPGGINTEVQYNSGGAFAGDNGLTYTEATETLTIASSVAISAGLLDIKNLGSVSELKLYCEVGNLHFTALKSAPHASYTGGSVTLTLPSVSPPNIGDVLGADDLTGTLTWITPATPPPGYTDADVDTHLNTGSATDGQILSYTSGDYLWIDEPEGFSGDYNDLTNKPSIPPAYGDADVEALFGAYDFHLIPGTNATFDIGTAEKKVRHLFLSDNSLRFVDGSDVEYPLSVDSPHLMFNGQQVALISDIQSVPTGEIPPDPAEAGDLWYSSTAARLFIYYVDPSNDAYWVDAAPSGATETPNLQEVTDKGNTTTNGATFGGTVDTTKTIVRRSTGNDQRIETFGDAVGAKIINHSVSAAGPQKALFIGSSVDNATPTLDASFFGDGSFRVGGDVTGVTDANITLNADGSASFGSGNITLNADGTVSAKAFTSYAAPSFTFKGHENKTGFSGNASNVFVSTNGTLISRFGASDFRVYNPESTSEYIGINGKPSDTGLGSFTVNVGSANGFAFTNSAEGAHFQWRTRATGDDEQQYRMMLTDDGNLQIGNTVATPNISLNANGSASFLIGTDGDGVSFDRNTSTGLRFTCSAQGNRIASKFATGNEKPILFSSENTTTNTVTSLAALSPNSDLIIGGNVDGGLPNIALNGSDGTAYFGGNISQNIISFAGGSTWDLKESNVWTLTNDYMPNPLNADAGQTGVIYNDVEVTTYGDYFKMPGGTVTPIPAKSVTPYFVQATNVILLGNSSKQYT